MDIPICALKAPSSSVPAARAGAGPKDGTGVLRPDDLSLQIPVSWVSIPEAYYASELAFQGRPRFFGVNCSFTIRARE